METVFSANMNAYFLCHKLEKINIVSCQTLGTLKQPLKVLQILFSNPVRTPNNQAVQDLKMEVIDAHSTGEGYKKIVKHCQLEIYTM